MGEDPFSFGLILAYKIKLVLLSEKVIIFRVEKGGNQNAIDAVFEFQEVGEKIDDDLFFRALLQVVVQVAGNGSSIIYGDVLWESRQAFIIPCERETSAPPSSTASAFITVVRSPHHLLDTDASSPHFHLVVARIYLLYFLSKSSAIFFNIDTFSSTSTSPSPTTTTAPTSMIFAPNPSPS